MFDPSKLGAKKKDERAKREALGAQHSEQADRLRQAEESGAARDAELAATRSRAAARAAACSARRARRAAARRA